MHFKAHVHADHVVAEWRDTADLWWQEFRCSVCGRLRRARK